MLGVLPEVVERVPEDLRVSDFVFGVEELLDALIQGLVERRAAEGGNGGRVFRIHPLHRARTFDILEPDEGVVGQGGGRRGLLCRDEDRFQQGEREEEEDAGHGRS